ncbi:hypothetical protein LTR56_009713 [Elasticomyces elasticus]|nr:hypothetical protein LTR22_025071 [Elasticomyces elasticus]KAK3644176.1 hypothetical protein LTR56_009713 [Elasticomyces elasticus]KAK4919133.1 hypothetical protein LTR49_013137 [Elasticomyces elasticus]KAK5741810.1 hypothetical protein LTS12_024487 [Elasticomyces elasticus]
MATKPCYFLGLPKELRLQIYDYLLRPDCIKLENHDSPTIIGLSQDEIARTRVYHRFTNDYPSTDLHPHILRVCHQVYEEALPSLHKPYTLCIEPSLSGPCQSFHDSITGKTVLRIFDAARLCNVRILPTLHIRLCTSGATGIENIAHSTFFANILSNVSEVKMVELTISDTWEEDDAVDPLEDENYLSNLEAMIKVWGDIKLKTDTHVWFQGNEDSIGWCKRKGGEWCEEPYSSPESEYGRSGRPARLLEAVKAAFA